MAAAAQPSYPDFLRQIKAGRNLAPVYILHGDEGFFTDRLTDAFAELIPEADRDFNLYTLYGTQTDAATVHEVARRYPMMADRQVVIVKEMQAARTQEWAKLQTYLAAPSPTTVLVLAFRGEKAKGKELMNAARKGGAVFFESKKLTDKDVGNVITGLLKQKSLNIESAGIQILRNHLGSDLSRIYSEIDKLTVALEPGAMVTPEVIEAHIGISKTYNIFELVNAVGDRNSLKAYTILEAFRKNPKMAAWPQVLYALFGLFSNLTCYHFSRDKSPATLLPALGLRNSYALASLERSARLYNAFQTIDIIEAIRTTDARAKGIGSRLDGWDLVHELLFRIFNTRG